jgi:sugar phosphate isomerase/epimerase
MMDIADRLSLSTCWCSARHTDGYEMVKEMAGLGFGRIELSHGIRMSLVPGIQRAVEEGIVEISSLHNFCPLPASARHAAPNLFLPTSSDSREQALWQRYTLQTLIFAEKLAARHVVAHSGSVWFFFGSPERKLDRWIDHSGLEFAAMPESEDFIQKRDRVMKRIRRSAPSCMKRLKALMETVAPAAKERGVQLCLENREGLEEMPLDDAFAGFLEKELPDTDVFSYWHDTGHARLKHQMGLLDHEAHLEAMSGRLAGFHLHDVSVEGRDHQVPGTGLVDFRMIARFVRPEHTLVLELSPKLTAEEVRQSREAILSFLT